MSYTLIIDTSTERGLVAIARGFDLLFKEELPFGFQSSRWVFPAVIKGLEILKIGIQDVKLISVGTGPGLFTGIRVGVALAKGLALSQKIPLLGFSSLEGLVISSEEPFFSCIDMRVGGFYVALRKSFENKISLENPSLISRELLFQTPPSTLIVGPTVSKLNLPNTCEIAPDAEHLARWSEDKFLKNEIPSTLTIDYQRLFL